MKWPSPITSLFGRRDPAAPIASPSPGGEQALTEADLVGPLAGAFEAAELALRPLPATDDPEENYVKQDAPAAGAGEAQAVAAADAGDETIRPPSLSLPPVPSAVTGLFPPGVVMSAFGRVEILSTEFATGWAAVTPSGGFAHVLAVLGHDIIGVSVARMARDDLDQLRAQGEVNAYAFNIVFDRPVPADQVAQIRIISPSAPDAVPLAKAVRLDRTPPLRIFLLGSPRSGTSEMGATLAGALGLPWDGEGHAGPLFAAAADALVGDAGVPHNMVRFIAAQNLRQIVIRATRQTYFSVHSSASFLDKTPGAPMIEATPFLAECFPDAKFIFLRRHPVANILSRMAKFGGVFDEHCQDWAATMDSWLKARFALPTFLEVAQEDMMAAPYDVANEIATYIGAPKAAGPIAASLSSGSRERTGAGLGKNALADSGWGPEQTAVFERICGPIAGAFGYQI